MSTLPPPVPPPPPGPAAPGPARVGGAAPGMATAALVCGITGLVMFVLVVPSIVAIVLGVIAWSRSRAVPAPGDRRGQALAGWILGIVGVGLFVLMVVGVLAADGTVEEGSASGGDTVAIEDVDIGDCIVVDTTQAEIFDAEVVDCDEPHTGEVYLLAELEGGAAFPGERVVQDRAARRCAGAPFEDYVGAPLGDTNLDVYVLWPLERSWAFGDRGVTCVVVAFDGPMLDASVAGTG